MEGVCRNIVTLRYVTIALRYGGVLRRCSKSGAGTRDSFLHQFVGDFMFNFSRPPCRAHGCCIERMDNEQR